MSKAARVKTAPMKAKKASKNQEAVAVKVKPLRASKHRRQTTRGRLWLPLPLSWQRVKAAEGAADKIAGSSRELAVFGKRPGLGTKAALKLQLSSLGWTDTEAIDHVLRTEGKAFRAQDWLTDVAADVGISFSQPDDLLPAFKAAGLTALVKKSSSSRMCALWESYTGQPWWLATEAVGHRVLVLVSTTSELVERASLAFVRDTWRSLSLSNPLLLPKIQRSALGAWTTPEALERLSTTTSASCDALVVHGGSHDNPAGRSRTVATLNDVRAAYHGGLLIYEMVVDKEDSLSEAMRVFKRQGFGSGSTIVFGLSAKLGKAVRK